MKMLRTYPCLEFGSAGWRLLLSPGAGCQGYTVPQSRHRDMSILIVLPQCNRRRVRPLPVPPVPPRASSDRADGRWEV